MNPYYRQLIANEFRNCVDGTISRVVGTEQTYRPFHTTLLSEEAVFWSAFERSFSTSFGQRVIEEIAQLVALSNGATEAKRQVETSVRIDAMDDRTGYLGFSFLDGRLTKRDAVKILRIL